jgi:hypothetical protein
MTCSCCQKIAKYEVDGSLSCGRCLVYLINMKAPLHGNTVTITIIKEDI